MPLNPELGAALAKILFDTSGAFAENNPIQKQLSSIGSNATGGLVRSQAFNKSQDDLSSNLLSIINQGTEGVTSEPLRESGQGTQVFPGGKSLGDFGLTSPKHIDPFQALALGQKGTEDLIRTTQQERFRVEKSLERESDFKNRLKVIRTQFDNQKELVDLQLENSFALDRFKGGQKTRDLGDTSTQLSNEGKQLGIDSAPSAPLARAGAETAIQAGIDLAPFQKKSLELANQIKAQSLANGETPEEAERKFNAVVRGMEEQTKALIANQSRQPGAIEAELDRELDRIAKIAGVVRVQAGTQGQLISNENAPSKAQANAATTSQNSILQSRATIGAAQAEVATPQAAADLAAAQKAGGDTVSDILGAQRGAINQVRPGILAHLRKKFEGDEQSEALESMKTILAFLGSDELDEAQRTFGYDAMLSLLTPNEIAQFRTQVESAERAILDRKLPSSAVGVGTGITQDTRPTVGAINGVRSQEDFLNRSR